MERRRKEAVMVVVVVMVVVMVMMMMMTMVCCQPGEYESLSRWKFLSNAAGADPLDGCIARGSRALQDPRVGSRFKRR
ncbi:hypothetical protein M0802_005278 [Mischocyttarus mexicanus]|nr:hypothetical protein M0802_005278 [Mischocyttarus mexicanus]